MKTIQIDLDLIEQNENSRVNYKEQDLADLMGSLKRDGLLQPVGVRKLPSGRYESVFGNRRLLAAKKLGWATIDATVLTAETNKDVYVLNLIENFKRVNTTLYEDGRMFNLLKDEGLSDAEIAARLGISKERVSNALEAAHAIPAGYQKQVVFGHAGGSVKSGRISATFAKAVINLSKSVGLTKPEMGKLLDYAKRDRVGNEHLRQVAHFVRSGYDVDEAIAYSDTYKVLHLTVLMDKTNIRALEKRYGKSVSETLKDHLYDRKEFKLGRRSKRVTRKTQTALLATPSGVTMVAA